MRESFLQMEFFETYYYANVVHNILDNTMPYHRKMNDWHEEREPLLFLQPFPKWSVLHDLIHYVIEDLMYESLDDIELDGVINNPGNALWVDRALAYHKIETSSFCAWLKQENTAPEDVTEDHIHEYHYELSASGKLDMLLDKLTNEVFYLLFGNRVLLAQLNTYIAGVVKELCQDELTHEDQALLQKDGVPVRAYVPEWARRAVYLRDRGMCAACNTDLTGLISVASNEHYDHIIPLVEGGINDVTNLQLLCSTCNLKKGRHLIPTSTSYQSWYSIDA